MSLKRIGRVGAYSREIAKLIIYTVSLFLSFTYKGFGFKEYLTSLELEIFVLIFFLYSCKIVTYL